MKLFHHIRKWFETLGVYPVQWQRKSLWNERNLFVIISLVQMFISSLAYFLYEAKSIGEYADSFFMVFTNVVCVVFFSISIFKMSSIHMLIGEFEQFIEKSEFMAKLYANKNVNKIKSKKNSNFLRISRFDIESNVYRIDRKNRTNV